MLKSVTERPPTYTAFRYGGTHPGVDALNAFLCDSEWTAEYVDTSSCRVNGPHGELVLDREMVMVFTQRFGEPPRGAAKFSSMEAAAARFIGLDG